jgi:hypothetical protein
MVFWKISMRDIVGLKILKREYVDEPCVLIFKMGEMESTDWISFWKCWLGR